LAAIYDPIIQKEKKEKKLEWEFSIVFYWL